MLDNWIGEILLIMLLIFFICPRDIPKILRAIGKFLGSLSKYREQAEAFQKELIAGLNADDLKDGIDELRQGVADLKYGIKKPVIKTSSKRNSRPRG